LKICGSWAKSQDTMLRIPRRVERNDSGVGTQVSKVLERRRRKLLVGVQC